MANLFDDLAELRRYLVFPHLPVTPGSSVRAPCCSRRTSADAVVDVRHLRTPVGRGRKDSNPVDTDWLCDGCRSHLVRSARNGWTPSRLALATGMEWPGVKVLRTKELVRENTALTDGLDPVAEYDRVIVALPDRDIPGTEIPPDGRKDDAQPQR